MSELGQGNTSVWLPRSGAYRDATRSEEFSMVIVVFVAAYVIWLVN